MQLGISSPGELTFDCAAGCADVSISPFGERCHVRASGAGGTYSIFDYRAPPGFGPAKHLHHREDEIIEVLDGRIAVWTPERTFSMAAGDTVLLPKSSPHAWRAFGPDAVHLTVSVVPAGFERFFSMVEERQLTTDDHDGLGAVARELGLDVLGPPLSDEEVATILNPKAGS